MKEIARKCFASLNHAKYSHYIILIDQNYEDEIWADNDTEAIQKFHDWCNNRAKKER